MAVDGKNASGRLAAATVLWLLVAIFSNQDCVYCQGEVQQQFQPQQFLPPQVQQQKPQQQPPPTQQQQSQMSAQITPPTPPQMQIQMQPQMPPQPPQLTPPQPTPLQQQQQQQQQQEPSKPLAMFNPKFNMAKEMQPNINQLTGQSMNPDFGTNPLPPQQQQGNVAGPLNMAGGGRVPMFAGGLPQMSTFGGETNQGINSQLRLNSQPESNPNSTPLLTNPPPGQNQHRIQAQLMEQLNNAQDPMNNPQHKFNMQPMPSMQHQMNHYASARPFMGQQKQYQSSYYPNNNMYEAQVPANSQGFPGQSYLNMGDLMQPAQMLTNLIPTNPMEIVQKPIDMAFNAVEKLGKYGEGVKDGLTRAFSEVVGKILDQGQSGTQRILDLGTAGKNAAFDFGRRILIPNSRNQQTTESGGRYDSPQASMSPAYGYNTYAQSPTQMGYAQPPTQMGYAQPPTQMGYMQPPTQMGYAQPQAGTVQSMGSSSNGQLSSQGAVPQYLQQRPGSN